MSKHPSAYESRDVYELTDRGMVLASQLEGEQAELVRELSKVLLNQAVRLAQIRLTLEVRG